MSVYLSKCLNVCLNMCIFNISICNTTYNCCLDFFSFLVVIINDFKQMGLNFQSGHGHVHIHMFYCNAWTLCLMCTIALFYSNLRLIKHDKTNALKMGGHGYMHKLI
jgi:hypothetical protein